MTNRRTTGGFTLIEMLVVIGVIVISAGMLGFGFRAGQPAIALQSGQQILASLLESARVQAVSSECRVTLLVDADPTSDGFLRRVGIALESAAGSNQWLLVDAGEMFPPGVFVLPPDGAANGVEFSVGSDAWTNVPRSSLRLTVPGEISGASLYLMMTFPFDEAGASQASNGLRWVLAMGNRTPAGVIFQNPATLRGVVLGAYGIPLLINEANAFEL